MTDPSAAPPESPSAAARRWLAECLLVETADGWIDEESPDEPPMAVDDLAQYIGPSLFPDDEPDRAGQLRTVFALVELLDAWWLTVEIRFAHQGAAGPFPAEELWGGYRRLLELDRELTSVTYSLWVEWFENRTTVEEAFAEVLGADIERIATGGSAAELRRAARVLSNSGPVPWVLKEPVYQLAATVPALHEALFRGLLTSYHDVYGDLEPAAALAILDGLPLPPATGHLGRLRRVLAAGHRKHHLSPEAWDAAADGLDDIDGAP